MSSPAELRYTKEHEWTRVEGDEVVVGITQFAVEQLGDVVYVDLPAVGRVLTANATFGVVESVKSVSDLYTPVDGEVVAVNGDLADRPELVNESPYGEGWMIRLRPRDPGQLDTLLTADAYDVLVG